MPGSSGRTAILRTIVVGLCVAIVVGGYLAFGGADPERLDPTRVSRIRISVETTVAGKPVARDWTVPAIRLWEIPEYWLTGGTRTVRTMRSPFDTVFMRLPTGQGLGVDLQDVSFNMTWLWQPIAEPPDFRRTYYYLLDSLDRPRILTDYFGPSQDGRDCPEDDLVLGCKVVSSIAPIETGPLLVPPGVGGSVIFSARNGWKKYDELRRFGLEPPKPMIFVRMWGWMSKSTSLHTDPELAPLLRTIAKPTIVLIDWPTRKRLLKSNEPAKMVELAYDGSNGWALEEVPVRYRSLVVPSPPTTAYRTEVLTAEDIICCMWPFSRVDADKAKTVASTIKYRRQTIDYTPAPRSMQMTPVLVDPDDSTVVTLNGPDVRVVWMMPSR